MMHIDAGDLVMLERNVYFDPERKLDDCVIAKHFPPRSSFYMLSAEKLGIVMQDHVGNVDDMAVVLIDGKYFAMWKDYLNVVGKLDV